MNKKVLLLPFLLLLILQTNIAQVARCEQQKAIQKLENKYPDYQKAIQQTFNTAHKNYKQNAHSRSNVVHQIQVVVHVVYNTSEQNISDELIHSQIQILNEDFRRLNSDIDNAREIYKAIGGDAEIEFVLADIDPDGNPTTGITRTQTDVSSFIDINIGIAELISAAEECNVDVSNPFNIADSSLACLQQVILEGGLEENTEDENSIQMDDVKRTAKGGKDPWDTKRYINIWVTNLNIDFMGQETPAILGFAYPPIGAPNWPDEVFVEDLSSIDGLVIHHQAFGKVNTNSGILGNLAQGGRTCTHEMGHYFGLRHIHGDGDCSEDDGISDTPAADASQQEQAAPNNLPVCEELHSIDTCPEDGLPDMVENYMDYNALSCQNLFTLEQVGIMKAMLEGPRSGLFQSTTSTESILANRAFSIYPNPTSNIIYLTLDEYELADFEVQVHSILGAQSKVIVSNNNKEINMNELAGGIYLVRLIKNNFQIVKKVSVLK